MGVKSLADAGHVQIIEWPVGISQPTEISADSAIFGIARLDGTCCRPLGRYAVIVSSPCPKAARWRPALSGALLITTVLLAPIRAGAQVTFEATVTLTVDGPKTTSTVTGGVGSFQFLFDCDVTGNWDGVIDTAEPTAEHTCPAGTTDIRAWVWDRATNDVFDEFLVVPDPRCGNGVPEPGEACDDGNVSNRDACLNNCKEQECGDGHTGMQEECDDGNNRNGDGCTVECLREETSNEPRDNGSLSSSGGCTIRTTAPSRPFPLPALFFFGWVARRRVTRTGSRAGNRSQTHRR